MPNIFNRDFSGGWKPSVDAANSPPNVLLRSDNAELEDVGVVSLRPGLAVQTATALGSVEVVKSVELGGVEVVLSATSENVYAAGTGLGIALGATADVAIDTVDGQALISTLAIHKKYNGTTVREWGIATPLEAPTVGSSALTSKTIANFTQTSAEFAANEGAVSFVTGQDGVANAATGLTPAVATGRGEMTYTFAAVTNLMDFSGSEGGQFDLFEFWFDSPDPTKFLLLSVLFGLTNNADVFQTDGYIYTFGSGLVPIGLTPTEIQEASRDAVASGTEETPAVPPDIIDPPRTPREQGENRQDGPGTGTREPNTPPGRESR